MGSSCSKDPQLHYGFQGRGFKGKVREGAAGSVRKKSSFYCFAGQRGPQGANALKTLTLPGEGSEEFYSVQGAGCGQLLDDSRIGWLQGEVSCFINLLVSTRQGSMFLCSAVFIWWVYFLSKQLRNVCQAFFCIFQGTGSLVILLPCRFIV